jgi:hypothetical protein
MDSEIVCAAKKLNLIAVISLPGIDAEGPLEYFWVLLGQHFLTEVPGCGTGIFKVPCICHFPHQVQTISRPQIHLKSILRTRCDSLRTLLSSPRLPYCH